MPDGRSEIGISVVEERFRIKALISCPPEVKIWRLALVGFWAEMRRKSLLTVMLRADSSAELSANPSGTGMSI